MVGFRVLGGDASVQIHKVAFITNKESFNRCLLFCFPRQRGLWMQEAWWEQTQVSGWLPFPKKRDVPSLSVWEISCDLRLMSLFGHVLGTLSFSFKSFFIDLSLPCLLGERLPSALFTLISNPLIQGVIVMWSLAPYYDRPCCH